MNLDYFYPFDSVNSDRKTTAATERRFWAALFNNGVVGADAFRVTKTAATSFRVAVGVAIVGGTVGGITSAKTLTVSPAEGASQYIAVRVDTTSSVRNMQVLAVDTLLTATQAQLESGAKLDMAIAKVTNSGGVNDVEDMRTYCTSFDAAVYESEYEEVLEQLRAETAGLFGSAGRQGFINPCFEVNQRGSSSYSLTGGASYTFDRWLARIGGANHASAVVFGRTQDGTRTALSIASKKYADGTTAAAASCILQNIEDGARRFCAGSKKFTVSFDAKASTSGARLAVEPVQITTSGNSGTTIQAQVATLTTSWKRYSFTFTGTVTPTAAAVLNVLKIGFFFAWRGYSSRFGEDNDNDSTYYLANMQINEGESGLSCYVRDYADELERCQRYYVALGFTSLSVGATNTSTNQVTTCPIPLTRRLYKVPTVICKDRANAEGKASLETAGGSWRNGCVAALSTSAQAQPVFTITNTDSGAVTRACFNAVTIDAEIYD